MILYLGLDPSRYPTTKPIWHYPLIRTEKILSPQIEEAKKMWEKFTHVIFTSRTAVQYWFEEVSTCDKEILVVGKATALALREKGIFTVRVAEEETQEGVVALLNPIETGCFFWPRSKLARPLLEEALQERGFFCFALDLYTTVFQSQEIITDWNQIDEIVFTSPSTVEAFLNLYGTFPEGVPLKALGPITQGALACQIHK